MPTITTVRTDLRRGINSGSAFKTPCKCATTSAITLSGLQTIDGIAVVADDSVLVKNQADSTFNGIYWAASGSWTRRPDFDGYFDTRHGSLVWVNQGTTNALTLWRVSASDVSASQGPLPGTSAITFAQVSLGGAATFVGFSAKRTSAQTSGAIVIWDNDSTLGGFDTSGIINTSTGVATIPSNMAGYWTFGAEFWVTLSTDPTVLESEMVLNNGAAVLSVNSVFATTGVSLTLRHTCGPQIYSASDTVQVQRRGGNWGASIKVEASTAPDRYNRFYGIYHGAA